MVATTFYIARIRDGWFCLGGEMSGHPGPLADLFRAANLQAVDVRSLEMPTAFVDFNDYWSPFLRGQGPAGAYCVSLSEDDREHLCKHLENTVPVRSDGSIHLIARGPGNHSNTRGVNQPLRATPRRDGLCASQESAVGAGYEASGDTHRPRTSRRQNNGANHD